MKRQKQIDESKDMISDAFARLMQDNDFTDLTLSQIAEEARVNRLPADLREHFCPKCGSVMKVIAATEDVVEISARSTA